MNVRQRQVHRLVWPLLLPVLGGAVTLGVALRPVPRLMDQLPEPLAARPESREAPLWSRDDAFGGSAVRLALYPDMVELTVLEPLRRPDPSVWWSSAAPREGHLPADAVLLGMLSDSGVQRWPLQSPSGHLVLFSLADGEVLATAALGERG